MSENNLEPQTTGGASKKMWYIVGGVLAVLIVGGLVFGALARTTAKRALERATGGKINYGADNTTTYTTDEGSVTIGGNSLPSNWPSDAPQYPGAKIQYSGSANPQTGEAGASMVFEVSATSKAVQEYYNRELTAKGWKIESTATMGSATTLGATKEGKTFAVYIVDAGNGKVNVTVGISGI